MLPRNIKFFQDNILFICKNYSKFKTKYTQVKEIVLLRGAPDFQLLSELFLLHFNGL